MFNMPLDQERMRHNQFVEDDLRNAYTPASANDTQVAGVHYKEMPIQPWEIIDANFSEEEAAAFYKGNALKYLLRAGKKGSALEDIEKARHYLDKLVEIYRPSK